MLAALMLVLVPLQVAPARGEIIAEHRAVAPGGKVAVGLRVELDPKWHIYWHNSGDSGMPTDIRWTVPEGVALEPGPWPAPALVRDGPLVMYGYEGVVLFTAEVTVPLDYEGETVRIGVKADWLVCADVCEEGGAVDTLELPVRKGDAKADDRWTKLFAATRALTPAKPPEGAVAAATRAVLRLDAGKLGLKAGTKVHFFARESGVLAYAKPQTLKRTDEGAELTLPPPETVKRDRLDRLRGVLVLQDGDARRAFAVDVPVGDPKPEPRRKDPK